MTTTAALYFIAKHKEVQLKLQQEIDEIFGAQDLLTDMNQLKQMNYLEQVICETMRLWVKKQTQTNKQTTMTIHKQIDACFWVSKKINK
jgi:cytochrome P450